MAPSILLSDAISDSHQSASTSSSSPATSTSVTSPSEDARWLEGRCNGPRKRRIKVAIVGSGLSGLVAAHLLLTKTSSDPDAVDVEVHIFERSEKLGMDSQSIDVPEQFRDAGVLNAELKGKSRVDTPMRSFNAGYYPRLLRLYRRIGIKTRPSNFTFSFSTLSSAASGRPGPSPHLLYEGSSGARGVSLPSRLFMTSNALGQESLQSEGSAGAAALVSRHVDSLKAYLSTLITLIISYLYLLIVALWHHHLGNTTDPTHPLATTPLSDWCEHHKLRRSFVDTILIPMFSAVMTARGQTVKEAPAAEILAYIAATFSRSHFTVAAGVRAVQERLLSELQPSHIHTGTSVVAVLPASSRSGAANLLVREDDTEHLHTDFAHVILATQADQSARFLAAYSDTLLSYPVTSKGERLACSLESKRIRVTAEALARFRYERSVVINHTDASLLPPNKKDWRDLNLVTLPHSSAFSSQASISEATMATHIICKASSSSSRNHVLLQTTNPLDSLYPDKSCIISQSSFDRAILSIHAKQSSGALFEWRPRNISATLALDRADHLSIFQRAKAGLQRLVLRVRDRALGPTWEMHVGHAQGAPSSIEAAPFPGIWTCGSWSTGIPLLEGE
ncbi:hypothetical protein CBOM_02368 [Ceraceosorus bombacis]|uniref:Uncharacterized protein n=1 Tax=Ceraceosorus bombacis TaxID=401625 RepID=A0A0N7L9R6_9BASI|nr:hypothetical protein CBOM_02368 [Ceraceosorus bombacis]